MSEEPRKYRPSNGTEGDWFVERNCRSCVHGKYEHTGDTNDKPCEILSRSFLFDVNDKEYPAEWVYVNGNHTCTARVPWDWNRDNDGNFKDPEPPPVDDPNQLCLPFLFDEIGVPKTKPQTA